MHMKMLHLQFRCNWMSSLIFTRENYKTGLRIEFSLRTMNSKAKRKNIKSIKQVNRIRPKKFKKLRMSKYKA